MLTQLTEDDLMRKLMISLEHPTTHIHNVDAILGLRGLGSKTRAIEATTSILFAMYCEKNEPIVYTETNAQDARRDAPVYLNGLVDSVISRFASYEKDRALATAVDNAVFDVKIDWLIEFDDCKYNRDSLRWIARQIFDNYAFEQLIDHLKYSK